MPVKDVQKTSKSKVSGDTVRARLEAQATVTTKPARRPMQQRKSRGAPPLSVAGPSALHDSSLHSCDFLGAELWEQLGSDRERPNEGELSQRRAASQPSAGSSLRKQTTSIRLSQRPSRGEILAQQPSENSQVYDGGRIDGEAARLQRKLRSADDRPCTGGSLTLDIVDSGVQYNVILALAQSETEVFDVVLRLCQAKKCVTELSLRPAGHGILQPGERLTIHEPWMECPGGRHVHGQHRRLIFFPAKISLAGEARSGPLPPF